MADLIFLAIMALALFIGYKTGFMHALVSFVGMIVSAIGGYLLYPYVTPLIMKTPINDFVHSKVVSYLQFQYENTTVAQNLDSLFQKYGVNTVEALIENMSSGITLVILNVLSVIIIIIGIKLAITIVKGAVGILNHAPIIGGFNKILGMLVSGVSAIIVIHIIVAVMLLPPSNTTLISKQMCAEIDKSVIVRRVMDYNIFISYKSLNSAE